MEDDAVEGGAGAGGEMDVGAVGVGDGGRFGGVAADENFVGVAGVVGRFLGQGASVDGQLVGGEADADPLAVSEAGAGVS